ASAPGSICWSMFLSAKCVHFPGTQANFRTGGVRAVRPTDFLIAGIISIARPQQCATCAYSLEVATAGDSQPDKHSQPLSASTPAKNETRAHRATDRGSSASGNMTTQGV